MGIKAIGVSAVAGGYNISPPCYATVCYGVLRSCYAIRELRLGLGVYRSTKATKCYDMGATAWENTQNSFFVETSGNFSEKPYLAQPRLGKVFPLFCGIAKKGRQNPKLTPNRGMPRANEDPFWTNQSWLVYRWGSVVPFWYHGCMGIPRSTLKRRLKARGVE